MLRVVLDTNILVSGELYPFSIPGRIVEAGHSESLKMVLSEYILEELTRVLTRLKNTPKDPTKILELVTNIRLKAEMWHVRNSIADKRLRDPMDQPVLQTLIVSGADYLITGDKDLLVLANNYPIRSPADFWLKHSSETHTPH